MPRRRVTRVAPLAIAAVIAACSACSGEETRPKGPSLTTGATTSTAAGGGGGVGGGGGDGGSGPATSTAAQGGGGAATTTTTSASTTGTGMAECGNGVAEPGEQCDGEDLGSITCMTFGFDTGQVVCTADCTGDASGCSGVETCFDALDNDGDMLRDCMDPDCAVPCADSCVGGPTLPDPGSADGDTTGHAALVDPSCESPASGPEVVYGVTPLITGMLDVTLLSDQNLGISVRSACALAATELGCAQANAGPAAVELLSVPVTAGQPVSVIVDGFDSGDFGAFNLNVKSRPLVCGDGISDPGEDCDDGNMSSGDGCSAACTLESSETEPNGTAAQAQTFVDPWFAAISPAGDLDMLKVTVPGPTSTITAETFDLGDGACAALELDANLEILGTNGSTVLAEDDDSGDGYCALVSAANLAAGTYYVRVKATPAYPNLTFNYKLGVSVQ